MLGGGKGGYVQELLFMVRCAMTGSFLRFIRRCRRHRVAAVSAASRFASPTAVGGLAQDGEGMAGAVHGGLPSDGVTVMRIWLRR